MCSKAKEQTSSITPEIRDQLFLQDFLTIMRNRLNVIGTSLYLLENSLEAHHPQQKYVEKMKQELEALRQLING